MSVEILGGDGPQQREKAYRLIIAVLGALVVVLGFLAVWQFQGKNSAEDDAKEVEASYTAGPDAQADAERILHEMISYDYREIDDEYEWTRYLADGELRDDYENKIIPKLQKLIRRTKAAAEGEIKDVAYNIVDDDTVKVLAFIRQNLTNVDTPRSGVIDEQWARLTMVRDSDEWLIGDINIVSVPPPR